MEPNSQHTPTPHTYSLLLARQFVQLHFIYPTVWLAALYVCVLQVLSKLKSDEEKKRQSQLDMSNK